jgi:hypothetical protein
MTDDERDFALTRDELVEPTDGELPEGAPRSLSNANVAIPVNAAVAANVLSDNTPDTSPRR